jgi:hypothetical protein
MAVGRELGEFTGPVVAAFLWSMPDRMAGPSALGGSLGAHG